MTQNPNKSSKFLHWYHWLVISTSLLLTVIAWKISDNQIQQKRIELFEIQSEQLLNQVSERMIHYEVALKAGAAAIKSFTHNTQSEDWTRFSDTLNLTDIYPGINGIGVIYYVPPSKRNQFIDHQRQERPDFDIHPQHNNQEYWPITYIEPMESNKQAVGLDIAFESNRFNAAKRSRDTDSTQITAPIILVQDAKKTPGFLQYIPFYNSPNIETVEQRQKHFVGLVYAPFIMYKLIEGTLKQSNRQLIFSITDGENNLYNELLASNKNYDESPIFKKDINIDMYGRPWTFHIQTASSFKESTSSNQPLIILVCGIVINFLLILTFITLSRAQQRATSLAKKMTRTLLIKEEYYRHIIESAPCGIIITNTEGEIEKVNPQTESLFGYTETELIGNKIDLLVPKRFQMQHPQHRSEFRKNPTHRRMGLGRDIFGLTKNENEFPAEIGLAQFVDNGSIKTLATIIDMTKHVQITEELKRSNKELNDFAYVASHDLKAPLRGIMQLSSWIEEDIADFANDDTKNNLALLMSRTLRLENLLEDLLSYSRIGRKVGDTRSINIKEFILSLFELQDPPKDVTLVCDNYLAEINTYVVPLEIIFRNLIGNAIKHKSETDLIITVIAQEYPQYYQFSVKDDGPGIPERHHEHIFELFKTLKPRDEVEGSGMGLSIIKKLLDYQGGTIRVESDGESGTCFIFTWPKLTA